MGLETSINNTLSHISRMTLKNVSGTMKKNSRIHFKKNMRWIKLDEWTFGDTQL